MHTREIFLNLSRYNQRVNGELFQVLAQLTDKARRRDTGSWFGSLHKMVNHLLVGDLHWLQRFKPLFPESSVLNDPRLWPEGLSWKEDFREKFEDLGEERRFVDERLIAWFEECPEKRYGLRFQYTDSAGNLRSATAGEAFMFLFIHQTHHRGQVAQLLDCLGLPNNFADNVAFLEGAG
jgi:uncharacterized damage-inducible protein DinB